VFEYSGLALLKIVFINHFRIIFIGSLKREIGVKMSFEAVEKWIELKPEIL
jgi:hypothetical protein